MPATAPVQFDQQALHESVARLLAAKPTFMYLTHYGAVRNAETLAVQFLAQVDAMAMQRGRWRTRRAGTMQLKRAFGEIYIAELRRSDRRSRRSGCGRILATDIELNAQGLGAWLDRN